MSCCGKSEAEDINDKINKEIKVEKEKQSNEVKILLLGAGESGKSTVVKQMKIIHGKGYSDSERASMKAIIHANVIQSILVLLRVMKAWPIPLGNPDNEKYQELLLNLGNDPTLFKLTPEKVEAIIELWKDSGVQQCYKNRTSFQISDSAKFFLDQVSRLHESGYIPTDDDILHARMRTVGVVENSFVIKDLVYRIFDAGGQRSERRKWIHYFDNVTAVLFVAAISEYDTKLAEDSTKNRMEESLEVFEYICNHRCFENSSLILFLNKIDLFEQKLPTSPLKNHFPDYEGDNVEEAKAYVLTKYLRLSHTPSRKIFYHYTCATNTSQVKVVINAVTTTILEQNLATAGILTK